MLSPLVILGTVRLSGSKVEKQISFLGRTFPSLHYIKIRNHSQSKSQSAKSAIV